MKKIKTLLTISLTVLLMLCMSVSLVGCGEEVETSDKKQKTISLPDVRVGSTFEITLKSYSGTAYVWDYEIDPSEGIEYISSVFVSTNDGSEWAGGGEIVYTFKALTAGRYAIAFSAKDVSQQEALPIEIMIYEIKIN